MNWIVWSIGLLVFAYFVWIFNRFIGLRNRVHAAWSDIDVQLKRRWDLLPALVETVKGYAKHEAQVLENVVSARTRAKDASSPVDRGRSESELSAAVRDIFVLVENYPELRAATNYRDLHDSLVDIEEQVQYARRYYNAVVRDLNILISSFPSNLIAGVFGFKHGEYFQLDDDKERAAPSV